MTRRFCPVIVASCIALASATPPLHAQDAAQFRSDLAHSGVYAGAAIATVPAVKWEFRTGGKIIASPAIAGGVAYVGSTDGKLYAIDAGTGAQKWAFATGARIASSPAISNGVVFFESYDGKLYAVDAVSGALKWSFATGGERRYAAKHLHGSLPVDETMPDPFDTFLSSPAVADGDVYFGSGDGNVYALDAASGGLKWKFETGDVVHASPAFSDGMLFIGSWDSYFYALDALTGALKWRFKTGEDPVNHNQIGIQSSAAVAAGIVYFGCRDLHLYALDEWTGRQLWAFDTKGSWVIASPAVRDGKVYAATSDSGLFFALDAKTGVQIFSLSFKQWPMFSSPAIAGKFAYIGSHSGKLIAVDLDDGRVAWQFATDAAKTFGPSLTNPDGTPNYQAAFEGPFYDEMVAGDARMMSVGAVLSSPVVENGTIFFGSMDGKLYALAG